MSGTEITYTTRGGENFDRYLAAPGGPGTPFVLQGLVLTSDCRPGAGAGNCSAWTGTNDRIAAARRQY